MKFVNGDLTPSIFLEVIIAILEKIRGEPKVTREEKVELLRLLKSKGFTFPLEEEKEFMKEVRNE